MFSNKKGFTILELLVVIAIIGTLSSVILVGVNKQRARARDIHRIQELIQIRTALELYYSKYSQYPVSAGIHSGWKNDCDTGVTFIIPQLITEGIFAGVKDLLTCPGHWGYSYGSDGNNYKVISHSEKSSPSQFIDPALDGGSDRCVLDGTNKEHIGVWTTGAKCWIEASTSL